MDARATDDGPATQIPVAEARDEDLAERAQRDFEAFAELYRRYQCPVYGFIRTQTRDEATAEDLTAQVFFKALSAAESFRRDGSYEAWLFRIARNTVLSYRSRRTAAPVGQVPESEDPSPSTASVAISRVERSLVWTEVERLSPAQREAVELRYLRELSVGEIARKTRRSAGAVRILLHRARTRLRELLEGRDE